jgi:hypothetical protein
MSNSSSVSWGRTTRPGSDDRAVTISSMTNIDTTMWIDFLQHGDQVRAMTIAAENINDFRKILCHHYRDRFRPHHAVSWHTEPRAFFESRLRKPRSGPLLAIGHHAAHRCNRRPNANSSLFPTAGTPERAGGSSKCGEVWRDLSGYDRIDRQLLCRSRLDAKRGRVRWRSPMTGPT